MVPFFGMSSVNGRGECSELHLTAITFELLYRDLVSQWRAAKALKVSEGVNRGFSTIFLSAAVGRPLLGQCTASPLLGGYTTTTLLGTSPLLGGHATTSLLGGYTASPLLGGYTASSLLGGYTAFPLLGGHTASSIPLTLPLTTNDFSFVRKFFSLCMFSFFWSLLLPSVQCAPLLPLLFLFTSFSLCM